MSFYIDTKWLPIKLAREPADRAKAKPVVEHPVVLDFWMILIRSDLECHEVAEVPSSRLLQPPEHVVGGARESQIDVLRGSGAIEPELQDKPTFERCRVPEHRDEAGQKAVEDRSCLWRANSAPVFVADRRRCSSACLNASGEL